MQVKAVLAVKVSLRLLNFPATGRDSARPVAGVPKTA
jgi:hypothetical protein